MKNELLIEIECDWKWGEKNANSTLSEILLLERRIRCIYILAVKQKKKRNKNAFDNWIFSEHPPELKKWLQIVLKSTSKKKLQILLSICPVLLMMQLLIRKI